MSREEGWSTFNELKFVKNMGCGVFAPKNAKIAGKKRLELLRQYLVAIQDRQDWRQIDKKTVVKFVTEEIAALNEI